MVTQTKNNSNRQRDLLPMILLLLLGFALRVWRLDAIALRGDEGFTMIVWLESLRDVLGPMAGTEPHPPVAVLSIFGWTRLVGETEFAARYLSVLAGTVTIAALYGMGRQLLDRQTGVLAAFLWAINPYQIWFAQDLRSNALWIAFSAVATLALLRVLRSPRRAGMWVLYAIMMALGLYTFYLELFVLAAHNLFALFEIIKRRLRLHTWVIVQAGIGALLAPWFLQPRLYSGGYSPTAGPVNLPWTFQAFVFGETLPAPLQSMPQQPELGGLAAWLAIGLIAAGLIIIWRYQERSTALFVTLYALLPVALLAAVEWISRSGYYRPRYAASSTPGWVLILALGIITASRQIDRHGLKRMVTGAAVIGITLICMLGLWDYYLVPAYAKAPPWRDLMEAFDAQVYPGDLIIRNYPDQSFEYYYHGEADVVLLPADPEVDPIPELENLADQYETIWFVPQPSVWDSDQVVGGWLNDHRQMVSEQFAGSFHLQQFAAYEASPDEVINPINVRFGDFVTLVGCRMTPIDVGSLHPGDTITIELFWQPEQQTDIDLTVFMHLIGPPQADGSPLWTAGDHPPQYGRSSTTAWPVETLLRDPYLLVIPESAPAGTYTVTVGFYDPASGERVEDVSPGDGLIGPGALRLFEVVLEPEP
ncbi:MAG: glycosyltransferase family 39 protein [Anaerolineae bacterium]|nr:glycosyltransferase family 39 protein [Anaerolineae bacterium]